jgi:hypothetical protein
VGGDEPKSPLSRRRSRIRFVDANPPLLRDAALFVTAGMDLEVGWEPSGEGSRNAAIRSRPEGRLPACGSSAFRQVASIAPAGRAVETHYWLDRSTRSADRRHALALSSTPERRALQRPPRAWRISSGGWRPAGAHGSSKGSRRPYHESGVLPGASLEVVGSLSLARITFALHPAAMTDEGGGR